MAQRSKDLFDDTVMTFGEHLEALRTHLWKSLIGVVIAMIFCLYYGDVIVAIVRRPLDKALKQYGRDFGAIDKVDEEQEAMMSGWDRFLKTTGLDTILGRDDTNTIPGAKTGDEGLKSGEKGAKSLEAADAITVAVSANQVAAELHKLDSEKFPQPGEAASDKQIPVTITSPFIRELKAVVLMSQRPVTLNVQEGFMTYLKLSGVAGLIVASPWVFYQIWMFVAAGLYPHERKYVYLYGGFSLALFLIGVVFCYYLVFPFVLRFLIGFNVQLDLTLQPRLSEWISFAIILPLMFGISFQLPLVMVFLERLQIVDATVFTKQRRMAILIISIISMVLTPADPISMLLMMFPLIGLYEFGILLCRWSPGRSEPAVESA